MNNNKMNESSRTPLSSLLKSITSDPGAQDSPNISNRNDTNSGDDAGEGMEDCIDLSDPDSDNEVYVPPGENENKYLKQGNGTKPLVQYFWNGTRWADAEHVLVGRKFFKKELIIISWNVCSKEKKNTEIRIFELGKCVRAHDPDLIAFQEVTPDILKLLLNQKWLREYFVSDGEGKTLGEFGCVIFSKVKFFELSITPLESKMERKAIISTVLIQGFSPIAFATFHLESNTEDVSYRASQMHAYMELTNNCPVVILVGDTSFTEHEKNQSLGNRFKDSWITLNHQSSNDPSAGLTYDTVTNGMARNGSDLKQLRLDRCYYTHDSIKPVEMNILQGEISNSNEWVSYHYGIMVKFSLKS